MVRVLGLVKGYTPVKVHMPDGNKVKINIRTDLLSPAGKNIVGTLQFNGTTVYIPKDATLTIGSSPKCEIRVKDPAVELFHAMISSVGETVAVEHLLRSGKTAVLSSSKEIKTIGTQDSPLPLVNGDKIIFALSGDKKFLVVDFKLRQSLEAEIQESLVNQLQPRPPIEQVSIEQASAGQALARVEDQPPPLKALVAGSPFAAARTIDDVLTLYPKKLKEATNKDLRNYVLVASNLSILIITACITNPFSELVTMGIILFGLSLSIINVAFVRWQAFLNKSLANALSQSDTNKVAHALAKVSTDEGDIVLSVLEKYDPTAADAIRLRLPREAKLASKAQKVTPELPPVRVRVETPALPPTDTRIAEQPAEEEVVAQEETSGMPRSKAE